MPDLHPADIGVPVRGYYRKDAKGNLFWMEGHLAHPPKYSVEAIAAIVEYVRTGATIIHAVRAAGFNYKAWRAFCQEHPEVDEMIAAAKAAGATKLLGRLQERAMEGDVKALMWLLSVCHNYNSKIHITGKPEAGHVNVAALDAEERRKLGAVLLSMTDDEQFISIEGDTEGGTIALPPGEE